MLNYIFIGKNQIEHIKLNNMLLYILMDFYQNNLTNYIKLYLYIKLMEILDYKMSKNYKN